MTDGPSVEADLWQYYRGRSPGQIEVLAPDLFDGTAAQLTQFKNETGATFPLLLNGAAGAGNENLFTVYGDRDNYAVISKQGIVRYKQIGPLTVESLQQKILPLVRELQK